MRGRVLLLLGAVASALVVLWVVAGNSERRDPLLSVADENPHERALRAVSGTTESAPSGSQGGSAGPEAGARRPVSGAGSRGRGRGPDTDRRATGTGPGSIAGRAQVPRDLRGRTRDLQMHVTRTSDEGLGMVSETWTRAGVIGADGRYQLQELMPGRYFLQLMLDGRPVSEPQRLALAAGERVEGRDFDFNRTASVRGRVFSALSTDPVAGARIEVGDEPAETSDADGRFTLYDVPVGRHAVLVRHPDHAPGRFTIDVPERGSAPEVQFALRPGAEARITAVGLDGKAVARLFVTLCAPDHVASAYTDEQGVALLRGLEPDARYTIRLPGQGAGDPPVTLVPEAEVAREVRLTWDP